MRAILLTAFGNPIDVLQFTQVPEPPPPGPGEVLVDMLFAPLDFSDLLMARGVYPLPMTLPSVIGNEGVGRVRAIGKGVTNVKAGDRVLAPLHGLTWAERATYPADRLFALPVGGDARQLAMAGINPPTASLLLSEYVDLKPGDWVVQNAANSGVGRSVIAFAKKRGLRTINLVRRPELVPELMAAGGDVVLVDGPETLSSVKRAVGTALPRLGIDAIAGPSTASLVRLLAPESTVVLYSQLSREPAALDGRDLIFQRITVHGFWQGAPQFATKLPAATREGAELIISGQIKVPIAATYPLSAIREAVAHAERGGKVLLQMQA
ncbi:zinc-dependent alcohol dehydrogenase family protein [Pendulispora brunnea]|uniref:enoyl-[acyl-carrier-protein] reductase n=1 Tax=Pendulispora brunnea TaxID=2905690 RepID=A0ABZ2JVP3_9BACT